MFGWVSCLNPAYVLAVPARTAQPLGRSAGAGTLPGLPPSPPSPPRGRAVLSRIFICYRREDSGPAAGRIYDRLESHFERGQVFMDVDDIPLGVDWRDWLDRQIRQCDLVLVVMGRHWLSVQGPNGERRLDAPRDFVRTEIEIALTRAIPLIPVLLEDAEMPDEAALPASIAPLAYRNAATVHAAGRHFRGHMEHLIRGIEWLLGQRTESPVRAEADPQRGFPNAPAGLSPRRDDDVPSQPELPRLLREAMHHLHREGRLTLADYMVAEKISRATAKRVLHDLATRGLVERRGAGQHVYYVAARPEYSPRPRSDAGNQSLEETGPNSAQPDPARTQAEHAKPELSLEAVERAVAIPIQERMFGFSFALVPDQLLFVDAHFVLAGQAQVATQVLCNRLPKQVTIGPIGKIAELVGLGLPGIALRPLPAPPVAIPYHLGFAYFELDRGNELWQPLAASGGFGLHVGGDFPGLQLELWAIRE